MKHFLVHISAVYAENRGAYGWPRIWRQLRAQGIRVGKLRVQRLMRETRHPGPWQAAFPRGHHRQQARSSDCANLLDRKFTVAAPNQAWVGDLTYIATEEGWLFLAVVIDLFSRKVVGLVDAARHAAQPGDRCSGDGLVQAQSRQECRTDLS